MRFRCNNPRCGQPPRGFEFESDSDRASCPRCGVSGSPRIHELVDVHFLVMGQGPLEGGFGAHRVACEPDRPHLALHPGDTYAASDVPTAVTCRRCMGTPEFREMVRALFPEYHVALQQRAAAEGRSNVTVDLGACGSCEK